MFTLVPVLFSLVTVIGLLATIFGFIGFFRAGRSPALSQGMGLSGAVLGLVAIGLATWGLVITIGAMEQSTPQLNQAIASSTESPDASPTSPGTSPKAKGSAPPKNSRERERIPLGTVAEMPPFTVKIVSVERQPTVSDSLDTHKAQGSYVIVRMAVENVGQSPAEFSATDSRLLDADGRQYNWDSDATISQSQRREGLYDEINPSQKITRVLVFDLPRQASPVSIRVPGTKGSAGVLMSLVR